MNYIISVGPESPRQNIGIEVQPPIGAVAAQGLAQALSLHGAEGSAVDLASVTRNDEVGTAFFVRTRQPIDPTNVGRALRFLMDPAFVNHIDIVHSNAQLHF